MNRGILATEYASLVKKADGSYPTKEEIRAAYENIIRTRNSSGY